MSRKTKNYVRNYTRYTTLKSHFLWFTLGCTTVIVSSTERYQNNILLFLAEQISLMPLYYV